MDVGTGLTILGGAVGSKELVQKILGPTADYLGEGMKDWTERRVQNLGRIFENAKTKLAESIDEPGAVPPKVLKGVLEDGGFCDDQLTAEYFGGVLASSRTEISRDDRGAAFISLLSRLSTYEIRSHYLFYEIVRRLYSGGDENVGTSAGRNLLKTFIPLSAYVSAMEFQNGESPLPVVLTHVMFGLTRESLIDETFCWGGVDGLRAMYPGANEPGIVFLPSGLGIELYLWAHGKGDLDIRDILKPTIQFNAGVQLQVAPGVCSTEFAERTLDKILKAGTPPLQEGL